MPVDVIVGREPERRRLEQALARAVAGEGGLVFLEGPTGSGKTASLRALKARVEEGALGELELISVPCARSTPYAPFVELLADLAGHDRRRIVAKKVVAIVTATAPLVLEALPVVGKMAAAGLTGLLKSAERGASVDAVPTQIADAVRRIAAEESALAVVLDEAHLLDDGSCDVVRRLIAEGELGRLVLVLAFDAQQLPDGHQLRSLEGAAALAGVGRSIHFAPLTEEDVAAFLLARWGAQPHPSLAAWLVERCSGNAAFLVAFDRALEEAGVLERSAAGVEFRGTLERDGDGWKLGGALAQTVVPASLPELALLQTASLSDDDHALLQVASIQGEQFTASVLLALHDTTEAEIQRRLAPLGARRLIVFDDDVWWNERSLVWRFDPRVLQQLFYEKATESVRLRRIRHGEVADALEPTLRDDPRAPTRIMLELVRHRREAGQPAAAAAWLLRTARAASAAGSLLAARDLAREALEVLGDADDDRLRAEATGLLLVAAESAWSGDVATSAGAELRRLADSGEAAAVRLGEPGPLAAVLYGKGLLLYALDGYEVAIPPLRRAQELAGEAGDLLGRVLVMARLGHVLDSGEGLEAGVRVLEEAERLLATPGATASLAPSEVAATRAILERDIGVARYDLGDYGAAEAYLTSAVAGLRRGAPEDLAWALSFRAQLLAALGRSDEALAAVDEGLAVLTRTEPQAVRAFLQGIRGRLQLERGHLDEAESDLVSGVAEGAAARHASAKPLLRIFLAELLVARARFDEAESELDGALEEAAGASRVVVGALVARVRLELARDRADLAADAAMLAVHELDAQGGAVPVFRADEVLWCCTTALRAAGRDADAVLARAVAAVRRRSESLPTEARVAYERDAATASAVLAAASSAATGQPASA